MPSLDPVMMAAVLKNLADAAWAASENLDECNRGLSLKKMPRVDATISVMSTVLATGDRRAAKFTLTVEFC